MIRVQYETEEEYSRLIKEHSNMRLKEDQRLFEGKFLVFMDKDDESLVIYESVPKEEFENLKRENVNLKAQNEALGLTVDSILTDVIPNLFG